MLCFIRRVPAAKKKQIKERNKTGHGKPISVVCGRCSAKVCDGICRGKIDVESYRYIDTCSLVVVFRRAGGRKVGLRSVGWWAGRLTCKAVRFVHRTDGLPGSPSEGVLAAEP